MVVEAAERRAKYLEERERLRQVREIDDLDWSSNVFGKILPGDLPL